MQEYSEVRTACQDRESEGPAGYVPIFVLMNIAERGRYVRGEGGDLRGFRSRIVMDASFNNPHSVVPEPWWNTPGPVSWQLLLG